MARGWCGAARPLQEFITRSPARHARHNTTQRTTRLVSNTRGGHRAAWLNHLFCLSSHAEGLPEFRSHSPSKTLPTFNSIRNLVCIHSLADGPRRRGCAIGWRRTAQARTRRRKIAYHGALQPHLACAVRGNCMSLCSYFFGPHRCTGTLPMSPNLHAEFPAPGPGAAPCTTAVLQPPIFEF